MKKSWDSNLITLLCPIRLWGLAMASAPLFLILPTRLQPPGLLVLRPKISVLSPPQCGMLFSTMLHCCLFLLLISSLRYHLLREASSKYSARSSSPVSSPSGSSLYFLYTGLPQLTVKYSPSVHECCMLKYSHY